MRGESGQSWARRASSVLFSVGVEGPPPVADRRCGIESGSGSVLGRAEQLGDLCPGPLHAPGLGDGERQAPLGLGDEAGEQVNVAGVIEEEVTAIAKLGDGVVDQLVGVVVDKGCGLGHGDGSWLLGGWDGLLARGGAQPEALRAGGRTRRRPNR
jgi:hypothetical protein